MKLSSFLVETTDHGSVMAAKVAPAAGGAFVANTTVAQVHLVPFINVPWSDFAAILACTWTGLLIIEWLYKKVMAFVAWRRARA